MIDHRAVNSSRGERGSAFVVALLVLVVLTIAGLALTLMTQTEMRIGANEREANRTLYATDSGIEVSAAKTYYVHNDKTITFYLNTTQQDTKASTAPPLTFSDQIVVTPLYEVYHGPAPGTSINQNLPTKYAAITYIVNATATRSGQLQTTSQTYAQKVLGAMIEITPRVTSIVYNTQGAASVKK
jgi:Tfp pilus assembly protein PilX